MASSSPTPATNLRASLPRTMAMLSLLAVGGLAAGCAGQTPAPGTRDVGNMAFPNPLPQGNISTTAVTRGGPTDVGNMAYPAPMPQGDISTTSTGSTASDTGNMAYPAPRNRGRTTRVR